MMPKWKRKFVNSYNVKVKKGPNTYILIVLPTHKHRHPESLFCSFVAAYWAQKENYTYISQSKCRWIEYEFPFQVNIKSKRFKHHLKMLELNKDFYNEKRCENREIKRGRESGGEGNKNKAHIFLCNDHDDRKIIVRTSYIECFVVLFVICLQQKFR